MIKLKGITWNHTRGLLPMVATSQRFTELHPEVEKRVLFNPKLFVQGERITMYDTVVAKKVTYRGSDKTFFVLMLMKPIIL